MKTLTLELDDQVASDLERMAGALGVPVEAVAINALRDMRKPPLSPTAAERLAGSRDRSRAAPEAQARVEAWLVAREVERDRTISAEEADRRLAAFNRLCVRTKLTEVTAEEWKQAMREARR